MGSTRQQADLTPTLIIVGLTEATMIKIGALMITHSATLNVKLKLKAIWPC